MEESGEWRVDRDLADVDGAGGCRAFADYVFGSLILHFFCVNFIN